MKRLILLIIILITTLFSADNSVIDWKNDLNEIGTHGHYRADWTKKVITPKGCTKGEEQRLDQIVLVSTNILNKKPSEWLSGKYLSYVNSSCDIWTSLRGTPKEFEETVDSYFKKDLSENKRNFALDRYSFIVVMLISIALGSFFLRQYFWGRKN